MGTPSHPLRVRVGLVAASLLALLAAGPATAEDTYFWNGSNATDWTAAGVWQLNSTTGPAATWVNGNRAVFDSGSGSVGVTTHLTAVGLEFAGTSGLVVGAASQSNASLTLTGAATITMSTGTTSSVNATLAGGTITVLRNAPALTATSLRLNGDNAFTGNLVVGGGGQFTSETNRVFIGRSALPATATLQFAGRNAAIVFERWSFPEVVSNNLQLNTTGAAGSLGNTLSATTAPARVTLNGVITGTGGLTFTAEASGTGSVYRLTNANTYSGGTTVANGVTLLVNNTTGPSGSGTDWVNSGGRVGGTGRIGGVNPIVNNEGLRFGGTGAVAPGDPDVNGGIGRLTVTHTVAWIANGTLEAQLGGLTDTDAHRDYLHTEGVLRIDTGNAAVKLAVGKVGNFEFVPGQTYSYRIAQADGGITKLGAFPVTIVPSFGTASEFSYAIVDGPGTVDYLVLNYTPVPEPGSVLVIGASAMGLGGAVRQLMRGRHRRPR
jgi:fibronectin-binding autotransporter adhesin